MYAMNYTKIKKRLYDFGKKTSIHGVRYIFNDNTHILGKIFWTLVFIISVTCMFIIFRASYNIFKYHAISFATETTYLDWNTTFPAISICQISAWETFWTPSDPDDDEDYSQVQQFILDVIFFTGTCYSCTNECGECRKFNLRKISKMYRKECSDMLTRCKWNGKEFDCCDKFLPLETEYGPCFSINSIHTQKTPRSELNMQSNRKTGPGELFISASEDIRVYFHAPEDVPFINLPSSQLKDVSVGETYNVSINVIEIANDEGIKEIPVERRGCRFPWETTENLRVHHFYSYSTCVVQCHADAHVQMCNCTHHLMPVLSDEKFCDIAGLECLTGNYEILNRLHAEGSDRAGLGCDCVPSCAEPEYSIVSENRGAIDGDSETVIKLQALPTYRFKRNVVRSTMDLVVSIGATAGLFVGASLLSIIEFPYLLFLRKLTRRRNV